jgi:hypothetical protein
MFFFAFAISCLAGLSLRLYFNPARIKEWVNSSLRKQSSLSVALDFDEAHLRLSRGALPQFAIELRGLRVAPAPECRQQPSVEIAELRLPLSLLALIEGRFAIGVVSAENVRLDIDGWKTRCSPQQNASSPPAPAARAPAAASPLPPTPVSPATAEKAAPWWTQAQLDGVKRTIEGFEFAKVELQFENKTKKVYLESLNVGSGDNPASIRLEGDLRIPPELTYGEKLPPLEINAIARPTQAEVDITAALSEGNLRLKGLFAPRADGALEFAGHATASDVPLSTLVPLFTKAGVVQGEFHPRFLWLDCEALIQGRFQGLLTDNPLELRNCEINGQSGRLSLEQAKRHPSGKWDPFAIKIARVNLEKLMETFAWQGPSGVMSRFGELTGRLSVENADVAEFDGVIENAQLFFINHNMQALQNLPKIKTKLSLENGRLRGALNEIEVEDGEFKGKLEIAMERHASHGTVKAIIDSLRLNSEVQRVMVGGNWAAINGRADGQLEKGRLLSMNGQLSVTGLQGSEYRFEKAQIQTELADSRFQLKIRSDRVDLRRDSPLFQALSPVFFGHEFVGADSERDWIRVGQPQILAHFPQEGGFSWDHATGVLEDGRIHITSEGNFSRAREIVGWVGVDYPAIKKLKWLIGGTLDEPVLKDQSKALVELRKSLELGKIEKIDASVLGLQERKPAKAANQ